MFATVRIHKFQLFGRFFTCLEDAHPDCRIHWLVSPYVLPIGRKSNRLFSFDANHLVHEAVDGCEPTEKEENICSPLPTAGKLAKVRNHATPPPNLGRSMGHAGARRNKRVRCHPKCG